MPVSLTHPRAISLLWGGALTLLQAGCGLAFFKELDSDENDESSGSGSSDESASDSGGACDISDDVCSEQDTLRACDLDSGEVTEYSCAAVCGTYVNFTCIDVGGGQHACWCFQPGANALDACTDLEDCLFDCGSDATGDCGQLCFSRTDGPTSRLLGALVHCAEMSCRDTCLEAPDGCAPCLEAAQAGLAGDCALERSLCDQNDSDDEDWPWP